MKTFLLDYKNPTERFDALSICLGYFDGVHLGHQALIKYARKNAKHILGLLTFSKPISTLIDNGKVQEVLTSLDDRFKIISKLGVDYYYLFKIDKDFLNLSDIDFIDILKKLNVKEVFVGEDFSFGKNRHGNVSTLSDFFDVHKVDLLNDDNRKISSQDIKNFIETGNMNAAKKLLGRNYQITGSIITGKGIGHTIGFPTLNLKMADNYVLPRFGVYKTIAYLDGTPHLAITNVGVNPKIDVGNIPIIEVHLKDYEDRKYSTIAVEFIEFVRDEIKFSNLNELKNQIALDVKKVFGN